MFGLMVCCLLFCPGDLGQVSSLGSEQSSRLGGPKTLFTNFDAQDLNPFNWLGNKETEERDPDEVRFEALYAIVECLSTSERKDCGKLVDKARTNFEHNKNKPTASRNSTEKPPTTTVKA